MRIVNSQQFLDLPAGTVFYKYEPESLSELSAKGPLLRYGYLYSPISDPFLVDEHANSYSQLEESQGVLTTPVNYWQLTFDCAEDEPGQLFAVLEPSDVASLIVRLTKALNDSGCSQEELVRLLGEASVANTLDEQVAE